MGEKKKYNRIRVVLAEKEVSIKELVERLGVTRQTVSRWVNNTHQPRLDQIDEIAVILGVTPLELINQD